MNRRKALIYGAGGIAGAGGCALALSHLFAEETPEVDGTPDENTFISPESIPVSERPQDLAYLSRLVDRQGKWGPQQLFKFFNAMTSAHLDPFGKSLELTEEFEAKNKPNKIESIHREILRQSSSIFTYPFKSTEEIEYHDLVVWCAGKINIPKNQAKFTSTFDLERQILETQFVEMWDHLDEQQRQILLERIDSSGDIDDIAGIAAMSGAGAIAALSTTVYFSGFAFYTSMSVVISTVAGFFGVTLPFGAYMATSSTIAAITGPIGWAIGAVCLAGGVAIWAGKADVRKTTATVMQLHCMKAAAIYAAGKK